MSLIISSTTMKGGELLRIHLPPPVMHRECPAVGRRHLRQEEDKLLSDLLSGANNKNREPGRAEGRRECDGRCCTSSEPGAESGISFLLLDFLGLRSIVSFHPEDYLL